MEPSVLLQAKRLLAQGLISEDAFNRILGQAGGEKYGDFRRSENVDDRRKEHFNSLPQAPQKPNVFGDKTFGYDMGLTNLDADSDFAPVPQNSQLSQDAGLGILDGLIKKYRTDRGNV